MVDKSDESSSTKVKSLRPYQKDLNLVVKVLEANPVAGRSGDSTAMSECLVGDETGSILFTARGKQVGDAQPKKYLELKNARIDMFKGSMRLAVNQTGTVQVVDGQFKPDVSFNLSLIEFEYVPTNQ